MATETNSVGGSHPISSCLHRIKDSKWTDVALITGFAAILIIGILSSAGVFNFIGTTHAAYLSYGMYGGAALFLIAEIIKVVLKRSSTPNTTRNIVKNAAPLTQEEVHNLKTQAKLCAQNGYRIFDRKWKPNPNGSGLTSVDPTSEETQKAQNELFDYLVKIIDKADFRRNPVGHMVTWKQKRGGSEEYRYPEDTAQAFFVKAVGKIRTLPNTAVFK